MHVEDVRKEVERARALGFNVSEKDFEVKRRPLATMLREFRISESGGTFVPPSVFDVVVDNNNWQATARNEWRVRLEKNQPKTCHAWGLSGWAFGDLLCSFFSRPLFESELAPYAFFIDEINEVMGEAHDLVDKFGKGFLFLKLREGQYWTTSATESRSRRTLRSTDTNVAYLSFWKDEEGKLVARIENSTIWCPMEEGLFLVAITREGAVS